MMQQDAKPQTGIVDSLRRRIAASRSDGESSFATYQVKHRTEYRYEPAVSVSRNLLHLSPRPLDTAVIQMRPSNDWLKVDPPGENLRFHNDYFGNPTSTFSVERHHGILSVTSHFACRLSFQTTAESVFHTPSIQQVSKQVAERTDAAWLQVEEFRHASPRIRWNEAVADYAKSTLSPEQSIFDAVAELTSRIHDEFAYDPDATHVGTETIQAFDGRAGVCQDFAHVQIAMLRSMGIPARYVSGYLRTVPPPGTERLVGADQSHAWLSVYAGAQIGWIDFDPTNACAATTDHIPIAVGRDYSDVTPFRGVVLGGGTTTLRVSVDVVPVDDE
ncbi:MAG: transglutaminase family protein [Planctomycetota bacterium]